MSSRLARLGGNKSNFYRRLVAVACSSRPLRRSLNEKRQYDVPRESQPSATPRCDVQWSPHAAPAPDDSSPAYRSCLAADRGLPTAFVGWVLVLQDDSGCDQRDSAQDAAISRKTYLLK